MEFMVGAGFQPDTAIVGQVCVYRPRPIMRARKITLSQTIENLLIRTNMYV